ncbi:MAG: DUF6188 family protein [Candidatus Korobacteraceae bacterium]
MSIALSRYPDRYEIALRPRSISRVYVDTGFDLQFFDDAGQTGVRIENPIAVVTENPRPLPRRDGTEEAPMGKIVVSSTALRKGKVLEILFAPGVRFWVEPHADENGWGPYGIQGQVIVCLPGSEMTLWFGRPKRAVMPAMLEPAAESLAGSSITIE